MDNFPWEVTLAVLGVVVPIIAAMYEFLFVGRKRLGYRVQMDTTATDAVHSQYAGALQQLQQENGAPLVDPSFVLLRVENNGATNIDTSDYAVLDDDKVGIRVRFPGRRVAGMVVTELSDDFLRPSFGQESGLRVQNGIIELPKVPLNRSAHYKVLAALERSADDMADHREEFDEPEIVGGIKGGVGNGRIQETKSRTGTPTQAIALVCFLVLVILAQLTVSLATNDTVAPLDCATGKLTLTGSTAFKPVLEEAAKAYKDTCPGASFALDLGGSTAGLEKLKQAGEEKSSGSPDWLAFSDGDKGDAYPKLLPRPIAFSLFTLVINQEAGVEDLSLRQIRQLYAGRITNWKQLNGKDLPVRLISRYDNSGTRKTFQKQILEGIREPGSNSDDCLNRDPGTPRGVVRCQRGSTSDMLNAVADTPGALGYSEVGLASRRDGVRRLWIDGHPATLRGADHGAYPFWETEYAYTYGEPRATSLTASFLRYLTNEVGKDIVRSHGHRPCAELQNPMLCRPS
ncbi:substrate-binding domain-containing protein [Streptomyces sp. 8N706]|uniref:substrate-binding domain-containing protein n=1 Tax=Streptomyces sp. 8N706 TaxID=3457416 RepID=UPI003FD26F39